MGRSGVRSVHYRFHCAHGDHFLSQMVIDPERAGAAEIGLEQDGRSGTGKPWAIRTSKHDKNREHPRK